jgi:hypothetical protein
VNLELLTVAKLAAKRQLSQNSSQQKAADSFEIPTVSHPRPALKLADHLPEKAVR